MRRTVRSRLERWPLARPFRISRGIRTVADVVTVELHDGGARGAGEAVPYARYGETFDSVLAQIGSVEAVGSRTLLLSMLTTALAVAVGMIVATFIELGRAAPKALGPSTSVHDPLVDIMPPT